MFKNAEGLIDLWEIGQLKKFIEKVYWYETKEGHRVTWHQTAKDSTHLRSLKIFANKLQDYFLEGKSTHNLEFPAT